MHRAASRLLLLVVLGFLAYMASFFVYPNVGTLARRNPGKTALMKWREAQWAAEGRKTTITQRWVPISRVSPLLLKAVLIGEDDKFYHHDGFDYAAIEQAFEKDLKAGRFAAGASTISQQLIKNLYLSPQKSVVRKIKEAILTWRMEHALTKRRILEIYINVAEWGDGIFGIEAAARHYYKKSARALTGAEAARLAAVLPNPIRYNPLSHQRYVTFRAGLIHSIMVRRGIAIADFQEVMATPDQPVEPAPADESAANATTTGAAKPGAAANATAQPAGETPAAKAPAAEPGETGSAAEPAGPEAETPAARTAPAQ